MRPGVLDIITVAVNAQSLTFSDSEKKTEREERNNWAGWMTNQKNVELGLAMTNTCKAQATNVT